MKPLGHYRRVVVLLDYSTLRVYGATYHLRHLLMMHGLRYDGSGWVWRGRGPGDVDEKEEEIGRELRRAGCIPTASYDDMGTMTLRVTYLCPFR